MAISLKRTGALVGATKFLVHGEAKVGKTMLLPTLPNPIVANIERGLSSIKDADLPYQNIDSYEDMKEFLWWLRDAEEAQQYESVGVDSISWLAELILVAEKKVLVNGKPRDPRQAYGEMQDKTYEIIRELLALPKHVCVIAKTLKATDHMGRLVFSPTMPGEKAPQGLPYFFDEVFALQAHRSGEVVERAIQTVGDGTWSAGDRSGKLDAWEPPDLGAIIRKIEANKETP
jgi:hypothetical protein